jgi:hypothetical protein
MRTLLAGFLAGFLVTLALAQPMPPQWTPIVLDQAKVRELMTQTPMVEVTRAHLLQLIERWENEAQTEAARRVPPPAPPPQ